MYIRMASMKLSLLMRLMKASSERLVGEVLGVSKWRCTHDRDNRWEMSAG